MILKCNFSLLFIDEPKFLTSHRGNPLISFSGYRYSMKQSRRIDLPIFIQSKKGNPLILLAGYRYSMKNCKPIGSSMQKRWQCSTHTNRGCCDESSYNSLQYVYSKRGNPLMFFAGYTFSLKKYRNTNDSRRRLWRCSTHASRGCHVVLVTVDETIVSIKSEHNHKPSYRYCKTKPITAM
ncbi:hypothetical protein KGM_208260 [Danaus plexippus plexippus]|uniref:FLYWCH-type domain-containing protein n=1 Tax=Danaus plexippus plexippus TaxID=278856 RepID=A0A212EXP5_DANPL|nr:hypothetical protein KGM_208260 [Danaus plexippus plexippus]